MNIHFVKSPDIVAGGLRFYRVSFYFFSSATLQARWKELNQNRPRARKWVQFENACPKSGISPPPKIGGPKTTCFRRLRNLTAILTASFGTKKDIGKWLETTTGLLHRLKMSLSLVHKPYEGEGIIIGACHTFEWICYSLHSICRLHKKLSSGSGKVSLVSIILFKVKS